MAKSRDYSRENARRSAKAQREFGVKNYYQQRKLQEKGQAQGLSGGQVRGVLRAAKSKGQDPYKTTFKLLDTKAKATSRWAEGEDVNFADTYGDLLDYVDDIDDELFWYHDK